MLGPVTGIEGTVKSGKKTSRGAALRRLILELLGLCRGVLGNVSVVRGGVWIRSLDQGRA